jgi:hypothetical protein
MSRQEIEINQELGESHQEEEDDDNSKKREDWK